MHGTENSKIVLEQEQTINALYNMYLDSINYIESSSMHGKAMHT